MKRACSFLRPSSHYCAESFTQGLRARGYVMTQDVYELGPGDVALFWNRHSSNDTFAREAESRGAAVVICENGYLGRMWRGDLWFALALDHHNGAGRWPRDDGSRWRSIGFELEPWRTGGDEIVILPQRSIGPDGVAMPVGWAERTQARIGGRIRPHPGRNAAEGLREDLERAKCVIVWGSGGGIKALAWGIPVFHCFPKWIGRLAAVELTHDALLDTVAFRGDRTPMFESLANAMYTQNEIESGFALDRVLSA